MTCSDASRTVAVSTDKFSASLLGGTQPRASNLQDATRGGGLGSERGLLRLRCLVRMFNLLLSDCGCPTMLSFLPDRFAGLLKIRISEHPHSYCGQLRAFPENRSPTFWTKVECHSPTAICSTRITFGDALSEPDLLSRIPSLNTESASSPALAFEAMAHGDERGFASNC
jgi:hypothetical protein